jgi:carotenoid cleavage dioxygenase-like enzyme
VDLWSCGAPGRGATFVDDFVLAPKGALASDGAWLIAPVFDAAARRTSFVVLDAERMRDGPVCEAALPPGKHVPWGLHGHWDT